MVEISEVGDFVSGEPIYCSLRRATGHTLNGSNSLSCFGSTPRLEAEPGTCLSSDDQWSDDGGSWWHPSRTAPSFRVKNN